MLSVIIGLQLMKLPRKQQTRNFYEEQSEQALNELVEKKDIKVKHRAETLPTKIDSR